LTSRKRPPSIPVETPTTQVATMPPRLLNGVMPAYPADAPPLTIALISDLHVSGPDMPPSRLARIVGQVNALRPDLVLIAGDLVSDKRLATRHYSTAQAVAPLARLAPAIATVANLGAVVLANEARPFGPLVIGGLDDGYTGHANLPATLAAMEQLGGAQVLLSHSPDPFPDAADRADVGRQPGDDVALRRPLRLRHGARARQGARHHRRPRHQRAPVPLRHPAGDLADRDAGEIVRLRPPACLLASFPSLPPPSRRPRESGDPATPFARVPPLRPQPRLRSD